MYIRNAGHSAYLLTDWTDSFRGEGTIAAVEYFYNGTRLKRKKTTTTTKIETGQPANPVSAYRSGHVASPVTGGEMIVMPH